MKTMITILGLWLAAMTMDATAQSFSPQGFVQDTCRDYTTLQDQLVWEAMLAKKPAFKPEEADVVRLRKYEYDLLSYVKLNALRRSDLPAIVFRNEPIRGLQEIPGRIVESRLAAKGVNIWEQNLVAQVFPFETNRVAGSNVVITPPLVGTRPSPKFPEEGDVRGANAYANYLAGKRDFADAVKHFLAASKPARPTRDRRWEWENLVSAAYCQVMAGDFGNAQKTMEGAAKMQPRFEIAPRGRFLLHLFQVDPSVALPPELASALPKAR